LGHLLGLRHRRLGLGHRGLRRRLRLPGIERRRRLGLAGDRLLELTHAAAEGAADLGEAAGAEHQQQNHHQERDMKRIVESHRFSV